MSMLDPLRLKRLIGVLAALPLLLVAGCAATETAEEPTPDPMGCVRVVIDFGVLAAPGIDECVAVVGSIGAPDALELAGIETEGTLAWGDASICRVQGRPTPDELISVEGFADFREDCDDFSPGAYWATWVKPAGAEWAYATVGIQEQLLAPGEAFGVVYTTGDGSVSQPPED